eukprot:2447464-Rhodomonas_salina.2
MSGTVTAYGAALRARYAMPGTETAYGSCGSLRDITYSGVAGREDPIPLLRDVKAFALCGEHCYATGMQMLFRAPRSDAIFGAGKTLHLPYAVRSRGLMHRVQDALSRVGVWSTRAGFRTKARRQVPSKRKILRPIQYSPGTLRILKRYHA